MNVAFGPVGGCLWEALGALVLLGLATGRLDDTVPGGSRPFW